VPPLHALVQRPGFLFGTPAVPCSSVSLAPLRPAAQSLFFDDDFKGALAMVNNAVSAAPSSADYYSHRAQIHIKMNNLTGACSPGSFAQGCGRTPVCSPVSSDTPRSPPPRFLSADAVEDANEAIRLDSKNVKAHFRKG
jgi:hypothetical protein